MTYTSMSYQQMTYTLMFYQQYKFHVTLKLTKIKNMQRISFYYFYLNNDNTICVGFSSPEHKVLNVRFCDGPLSVVHCPCVRASVRLNDFFSWTAYGNLTKLNRNGPWMVPYINCSNGSNWLHKYVTELKNRFSFKPTYMVHPYDVISCQDVCL